MNTLACDICGKPIRETEHHPMSLLFAEPEGAPTVRYRLDRTDSWGAYDSLDICSAECLAQAAVGEGHERGERDAKVIFHRSIPSTKRRWWQRSAA